MSQRNERSSQPEFNGVTHWLIHHAAHRAPDSLSSRLEEEWLADLESRSSTLSRLRFAAGCCWASLVIVHEFARNRLPATSAVSSGGVVTLHDRNFSYFSLRSATLFLIAGLHAALFYGMITTLQHTRGSKPPPQLENQVLKPVPRDLEPLPKSAIENWIITVPPLDPLVPPLPPIAPDVRGEVTEKPTVHELPPQLPEIPPHVVSRVAGGPGAGFPDTSEFYPAPAIRADEQGVSTVNVCVDPRGRLISAPTIEKSSGFARLDEGAIRLARAGSGHYLPSTEDGQAVSSCYPVVIRFQLKR